MDKEKIEVIFTDYLKKQNTQYALLLNGKWGSGKTFFWKNILKGIAGKEKFESVYISLNGINSISELEGVLFTQVLPLIKKIENPYLINSMLLLRNATNVVGNIFGGGTKLKDLFLGVKTNFNLSKTVFCFDDLERCSVSIDEVLGFINNYTEHKNVKVIICGDESEIIEKDKYNRIKEKTIGNVLAYLPNLDSIYQTIIYRYSEDKLFEKFLRDYKSEILSEFKKHGILNLRTLNFCIDVIKYIHPVIKSIGKESVLKIIFFISIICIEYKNGKLTSSDYKDAKGLEELNYYDLGDLELNIDNLLNFKADDNEKDKKVEYNEYFKKKYINNDNIKLYKFYKPVFTFILTGFLNKNKLIEILKADKIHLELEETKQFNKLMGYNFRDLSNEEFNTLTSVVIKYAEEGKYSLYDMVTINNNYLFYINNDLLNLTEQKLNLYLESGLEKLKDNGEIDVSKMDGLKHFYNQRTPEEQAFVLKVEEIHNQIYNLDVQKKALELFEILNKNNKELKEFFTKYNYSNELFKFLDVDLVFEIITEEMSNEMLKNLIIQLKIRYENFYFENYIEDLPFFEDLDVLLYCYIEGNIILQPKKFLIKDLSSVVESILDKLSEDL
ncbi:hypothetical protein BTO15_17995 [Polaribacter sejongensis]|uniref:KAP NTPase domain-containing protein n=1 Tax=Polaribacter sejongensis TaxID=985043 RepID=A0ABM6Q3M7_9FLAO|nr:P-loop NTPase fold protein [Polaribacter sejongensis]AUC23870.1 hypothetical protein BTO15_17995 [Polaribacter sejongensis]